MNRFEFVRAKSARDAAELLSQSKDAALKAAGTDLLDRMKSFLDAPSRVVSLLDGEGLREIRVEGGGASIGALATLAQIAERFREGPLAALGEAAGEAATPQIRNVATLGGNLCQRPRCWYYRLPEVPCLKKGGKECPAIHGDNRYHGIFETSPCPIVHPSNLAVSLVAFGATIHVQGPKGTRDVVAPEFFVLPKDDIRRENVLSRDELITGVTIAAPPEGTRSAYYEAREKESFDWALVSAAAVLRIEGGVCRDARVVLGSVAPIPWPAPAAAKSLAGKRIDEASAAEAGRLAFAGAAPLSGNAYKMKMGPAIVKRTILKAAGVWKE